MDGHTLSSCDADQSKWNPARDSKIKSHRKCRAQRCYVSLQRLIHWRHQRVKTEAYRTEGGRRVAAVAGLHKQAGPAVAMHGRSFTINSTVLEQAAAADTHTS